MFLSAVSVLAMAAVPIVLSAQTPVGTAFTYQGQLKDGGSPANGLYDFEFTLYDDPSAGSVVAGPLEFDNEVVSNGLFTVRPDFGSTVFTDEGRWLRIGVRPYDSSGAYTYLDPRQAVMPTPLALHTRGLLVDDSGIKPLHS